MICWRVFRVMLCWQFSKTRDKITANSHHVAAMKAVLEEYQRIRLVSSNALEQLPLKSDVDFNRQAALFRDEIKVYERIEITACPQLFTNAYRRLLLAMEHIAR